VKRVILSLVTVVLAGCVTTNVVPTGKDTYLATVRNCGFCTASATATEAAAKYCAERGQVSTVTNIQTVFGSGAADVQFTCSSPAAQKPARMDNGTSTLEVQSAH